MISPRDALMVVLARRTRSRSEQKRVETRFKAILCLNVIRCGDDVEVDCVRPADAARGQCSKCYQAFMDYIKTLPADEAVRVEQEAIARGLILAPQEARSLKTQYAFKRLTGS